MGKILDILKGVKEKQLDALNAPSLPKEFVLKSISDSNINPHVVAHLYPKSPISEQYRKLRENIKTIIQEHNVKVLAVTSSVLAEGKSITALNLAVSMTKDIDCRNVLLVDCDLRRGNIDGSLGLKSKVGLSEYLLLGADTDSILYKTKINKLTIIPRGKVTENPAELLASAKMGDLLEKLKKKFDFIVLDTPPVIPIADSSIISAQADGVLMVVRAGKTQRGVVKHAQELLDQAKANLLGYVLTHIEYYVPEYIYKYV